jgi:ABC-type enterochelin transport system ATPase subunit
MDPRFVQAGLTAEIISTQNLTRLYGIPVKVERVNGRLVVLHDG